METARVIYRGPYPEGQTVRLPHGLHAIVKPGELSPPLERKVAEAYAAINGGVVFEIVDEKEVIDNA